MAALTKDRNTPFRAHGTHRHRTRKLGAVKVYKGGIACIDANGHLVPGSDTAGLKAVGIFEATVDNSGGVAGAKEAPYVTGVEAQLENDGGAIGQSDLVAYVKDDQSATDSAGAANDVKLGPVTEFTAAKVWVMIDELANL